jgi:feruloyl esterase
MHHCAGGTGPSDFGQNAVPVQGDSSASSVMLALQDWVEQRRPPEQLIARQQSPVRTGLICAYPKRATLKKDADPLRAENYSCRDP